MAKILTYPKGIIKTCPHCKVVFEYYPHEVRPAYIEYLGEIRDTSYVECPLCKRNNYIGED
jgi:phage FluMu protein Com